MTDETYPLRPRDLDEIGRLEHQHETWREATDDILDRAGLSPGQRVADLGCGPGFLALDLARRVAPGGSVLAIDSSGTFIAHLRERAAADGLDVEGVVADLVPVLRVGRPGTRLWDWLDRVNRNHAKLVETELLTADELQAYYDEWDAHTEHPGAFFVSPLVLATIARSGNRVRTQPGGSHDRSSLAAVHV